jgi:hypothetical protein
MHYVRYLSGCVDGQEKENLKSLDLPIQFLLFDFLEILMPPAAKNLFEKRFLDLQKLLFCRAITNNFICFVFQIPKFPHNPQLATRNELKCFLSQYINRDT